jgi:hypothetical protein
MESDPLIGAERQHTSHERPSTFVHQPDPSTAVLFAIPGNSLSYLIPFFSAVRSAGNGNCESDTRKSGSGRDVKRSYVKKIKINRRKTAQTT